jgi:hypothetical protein
MGDVARAFADWEMAHPGISSHHVATPAPIDPADATRITPEASRAAYTGPYWGMAQLLKATANGVVDHVAVRDTFDSVGVACHELAFGPRANPAIREPRYVLFKEADGGADIDPAALFGAGVAVRVWNPVDRSHSEVSSGTIRVAEHPVILERASAPIAP